ncbi:hypothetical protein SDC9_52623 [bioreactor metagenome]|uniref:Uncharacterized protein n=1 Tax=bioreactor metagenome TaxID=1076179 RepID=A0A644WWA9_9ZZZZ
MARFTQYIGLSPAAYEFLSKHDHKERGTWHMTDGIAFEEVSGRIYEVTVQKAMEDGYIAPMDNIQTFVEIEQVTPWSSGPMIHTCLMQLPGGQRCYEWKEEEIHYD